MEKTFRYAKSATETFGDARQALESIGIIKNSDDSTHSLQGSARFGLQSVTISIFVVSVGIESDIEISCESDDVWNMAVNKTIERFINALPAPTMPQPESNTAHTSFPIARLIPATIVIVTVVGVWISSLGVGHGNISYAAADALISGTLRSPSSFAVIKHDVILERPFGDTTGYVVKVEYDAQNGFGAIIRDCKYVIFKLKGKQFSYNRERALQECLTPLTASYGFTEQKWEEQIMSEANSYFDKVSE